MWTPGVVSNSPTTSLSSPPDPCRSVPPCPGSISKACTCSATWRKPSRSARRWKQAGGETSSSGRVARVVPTHGDIPADLVLIAVGVKPNVTLAAAAGLAIGPRGGIVVDGYLRTSDPDIFAGGDCVENRHLLSGEAD